MHVTFTRSSTGRKGKGSVRCTLTHSASPQDTQPAGLLRAPLWAVPRIAGKGLKGLRSAGPAPQTHKVTVDTTPSSGMTGWLTQSMTLCLSCHKMPLRNVLHRHRSPTPKPTFFFSCPPPSFPITLYSSSTPPPHPTSPKLLCPPLPQRHSSYRGCQPCHFTSLFLPFPPFHLSHTFVLYGIIFLGLPYWSEGASWLSRT